MNSSDETPQNPRVPNLVLGAVIFCAIWIITTFLITTPFDTKPDDLEANEVVTQGEVIDVVFDRTERGNRICFPVAEFKVRGEPYRVTSLVSSSPCTWGEGDTIDVIYEPLQVSASARVHNDDSMKLFTMVLAISGVLIAVTGAGTLSRALFRRSKSKRAS